MSKEKTIRLHSTVQSVPLVKMAVSPVAQRDLNTARVNKLLADFDPEQLGYPTVSKRGGNYYIIDGQHRVEAVKLWLGEGWESQNIDCRVYTGISEQDEAEMFDRLNNTLQVRTFDKFKIRVTAGRPTETNVKKVVEGLGLCISKDKVEGAISAVGTLVRVYERSDPQVLTRSLRIVRDSFGDAGLEAPVIDGIAHLCQRYNGSLEDRLAVERLSTMRGGVGGLMSRAEVLRKQTGNQLAHCVAAAAVDVMNAKRGGKKLPSWWAA